ncbi:hypothetical protein [Longimicrobium sp.]|uniref:hypothetical protein n=1 Tax=Longimicrobium sp. TaxID=2029185 RepID=UPI002E2ED0F2|nr:hypothetical protein [Longimicrobium sp.]HEX6041415.1 hypothetical protein [Longimicrobium sp.]
MPRARVALSLLMEWIAGVAILFVLYPVLDFLLPHALAWVLMWIIGGISFTSTGVRASTRHARARRPGR